METSDFFKTNKAIPESESRLIGACALCDPEFAVKTKHSSIAKSVFNVVTSPLTILKLGPTLGKALMWAPEWIHYKFKYNHHFSWNDFGKNPYFRAPILSLFPDEKASQGGIATGKCTAYHGCKERDYQFVRGVRALVFEFSSQSIVLLCLGYAIDRHQYHKKITRTVTLKYTLEKCENLTRASRSNTQHRYRDGK